MKPPVPSPVDPDQLCVFLLQSVEGLDIEHGLRHVGGRHQLLLRVLRSFTQTYPEGLPALLQTPTPELWASWRASCHSLRGACATVGALPLGLALQNLEPALDEVLPDPARVALICQAVARVHHDLLRLVKQLNQVLDLGP